jgi:putative membrane-bound dehydrogenase-like protein
LLSTGQDVTERLSRILFPPVPQDLPISTHSDLCYATRMNRPSVLLLLLLLLSLPARAAAPVPLFDGRTFTGWEGDTRKTWRIEDGVIIGGTLQEKVPHNEFLCTTRNYTNYVLRLKFKLVGTNGFVNGGVQFRSQRVPKGFEMSGYQADIGDPGWWGSLYDESRRNKVLVASDMTGVNKVLKRGEWNDYVVRCEGRRIQLAINGYTTVDYTETDPAIPIFGRIGFQIHGGGFAEANYKDITVEELPVSAADLAAPKESPLSGEDQQQTFALPAGFTIELVAADPEITKTVAMNFDDAGRLWTTTAREYPVDGNETPAVARALYEIGGRDRILVFDTPTKPGRQTPRVFADGLSMPMGVLPVKGGAIVGHGPEILLLKDTDGDGKADLREVLLSGFGIQDSHLMPHQFTRGPGGWIYFAQGAFNYSKVQTREGTVVQFDQCKMARFKEDGTRFEIVEAGLNNIWGFVIDRSGEMFIQEANDLGYPVVPFFIGASYPGGGMHKLKPYAPWQPPLAKFTMGGTGLSGLALSEDRNGFPSPHNVMYLANPITRMIQAVAIRRENGSYSLEKMPDFITSSDQWFRPIAIQFGPDGCLYIVDWYNKIISHNEVPRNHPERDKSSGRIWRVRHQAMPQRDIPNVAKLPEAELVARLEAASSWEARAAVHQIIDRKAVALEPQLQKLLAAKTSAADTRIRALWALEGLQKVTLGSLQALAGEADRGLRREAVRVLGTQKFSPKEVAALAERLADDPDPQVRAEVIRTLGNVAMPDLQVVGLLVRMGREVLDGEWVKAPQGGDLVKTGAAAEREFERYLVRAALEKQPLLVTAFLDLMMKSSLPVENRVLAILSLDPKAAASRLAAEAPGLKRPLQDEELVVLAQDAGGRPGLTAVLQNTAALPKTLETLLRVRNRVDEAVLSPLLAEPVKSLWQRDAAQRPLVVRVASTYHLTALEPELVTAVSVGGAEALSLDALKALRELGSAQVELFHQLATTSKDAAVRSEAVTALASARSERSVPLLLDLWNALSPALRRTAVERLAGTKPGGRALLQAVKQGEIARDEIDGASLDKLKTVLADDAEWAALLTEMTGSQRRVLRLSGTKNGLVASGIELKGPFTVETWIKLDPGIDNSDGLLGLQGALDLNFHQARLRVYVAGQGDVLAARKAVVADTWTHVAVTRDAQGKFKIYLNGELDNDQSKTATQSFSGLDIGRTTPQKGTGACFTEYRVWNVVRSADEIRGAFDVSFQGEPLPKGLAHYFPGEGPWGLLRGGAKVEGTMDFPPLLSAAEARAQEAKFNQFRQLAGKAGNPAHGRELFQASCLLCHNLEGKGGTIAPPLNGAGLRGTEGLLRALITPSAAIESGYRKFRVETRDSEIVEGFLVSQDESGVVLRQVNSQDQRIPRANIKRAGFTKLSVMPEGLLESMKPEDVTDLFAFLQALK